MLTAQASTGYLMAIYPIFVNHFQYLCLQILLPSLEVHQIYSKAISDNSDEWNIGEKSTSSKESPLGPVHGQQYSCPQTDALGEIYAAPEIYG